MNKQDEAAVPRWLWDRIRFTLASVDDGGGQSTECEHLCVEIAEAGLGAEPTEAEMDKHHREFVVPLQKAKEDRENARYNWAIARLVHAGWMFWEGSAPLPRWTSVSDLAAVVGWERAKQVAKDLGLDRSNLMRRGLANA